MKRNRPLQAGVFIITALLCVTVSPAQSSLTGNINQTLGLDQSTVQTIDVFIDVNGELYAEFESQPGVTWTIEASKYSQRADGFQLLLDEGNGELVQVDPPALVTYKGTILEDPTSRVRCSYVDNDLRATITTATETIEIQPVADAGMFAPGEYVVYNTANVLPDDDHFCGTDTTGLVATPPGGQPAGTGFEICEIAIDCDFEYYQARGSSVTAVVNAVETRMNAVENVYDTSPVNIVYEITTIVIRTSSNDPYTSTDPDTRLNQFEAAWESAPENAINRDVAHLFTSANINGGVIGIASLSAVCDTFDHYGLSEEDFSGNSTLRTALVAHELGHNWNAGHCDGAPGGCKIMCAFINSCNSLNPLTFSPQPQNQIISYRNAINCLHELGPALSLPFLDTFPSSTLSQDNWSYIDGATASTAATNEPSAPRSLNLDSPGSGLYQFDEIRSNIMLLQNADDPVLDYLTQHKGVQSGETLTVQYLNSALDWVTLQTIVSNGVDQTNFVAHSHNLPANAEHNNFRIRFLTDGNQTNDDWYIDDVSVTEGGLVPDPPIITFISPPSGPTAGGTFVTISGANFDPAALVLFGSQFLQNQVFVSASQITGTTPAGNGSVNVTLSQGTDTVIVTNGFAYVNDSLRVADVNGAAGSTVQVDVFASHDLVLDGFSFGVDHQDGFATLLSVTSNGTDAEGAAFFAINTGSGNFWTVGAVIDLMGGPGIPPGTDNVLARATYSLPGFLPMGTVIDLELRDDLGTPMVEITFVETGGVTVIPALIDGSITISADAPFIRGDVDFDGTFNALVDTLYLLGFGFSGGPPPVCDKAADVDDNGVVNPLVDSIYELNHGFSGGPPPPAPYPSAGTDPTPDALTCTP